MVVFNIVEELRTRRGKECMLYENKEYVLASTYLNRTAQHNVWSLHWKCRKCERTVLKLHDIIY